MKKKIEELMNKRLHSLVGNHHRHTGKLNSIDEKLLQQKIAMNQKRAAEIVKSHASVQIVGQKRVNNFHYIDYNAHIQYVVKQNDKIYVEESFEERIAMFENGDLINDDEKKYVEEDSTDDQVLDRKKLENEPLGVSYNRLDAVKYAERWWNSFNPKYKKFENDCTNFISQCLHAGGIPMVGYPSRTNGWWMKHQNWSYSWTVANSFRWYLSGAKSGLRAKEVFSAKDLLLGDVICYDFEGDGRYNHATIVVAKDEEGMPLVNAHTQNSRMRYWTYEDSTAYTPNITYKFFHILDG
ncbi:amidase domain-containing protein [Bacillus timonensis]|nr:amidase domain-containing protein [Bacillus timonensis]